MIENLDQKTAQVGTYGGSVMSVGFGLTLNEAGVIVGIVMALLGFGTQIFFSIRRDRRERAHHRKMMRDEDADN